MGRKRFQWDELTEAALRDLRRRGESYKACAEAIGVDDRVVQRKAQELGLSARMNQGTISGPVIRGEQS